MRLACWAFLWLPLLAAPAVAQEVTYVDDPLTGPPQGAVAGVTAGRQGGSFGADGWTVTGDEDTLWYVIPAAFDTGRVEVTVEGLSTETNLTGELHDLLVIYGTTDAAEPVSYAPRFRSNDFKVQVRVIGTAETSRGPGANKMELRICPMGDPGYHEFCDPGCGETVGSAYLNGAPMAPLPWNAERSYRLRVSWEPGRMTYDRDGNSVSIGFPDTYAPENLVVRLGSPRHTAGSGNRMPGGLVMRDLLVVGEPSASAAVCGEEPEPEPPCLRGVSVDPSAGSGEYAILRATYAHCDGADAFRIVQIWVGDEVVVNVPQVAFGYEDGRFSGAAGSCAAGDAARVGNTWGGLDCAASSVRFEGDEAIVDWAIYFDPAAFAGNHGVFFDAKGGTGNPEPRLGWTRMGSFTVVDEPEVGPPDGDDVGRDDAGAADVAEMSGDAPEPDTDGVPEVGGGPEVGSSGDGAGSGAGEVATDTGGGTSRLSGGCGCDAEGEASAAWTVCLAAALVAARGRRRSR